MRLKLTRQVIQPVSFPKEYKSMRHAYVTALRTGQPVGVEPSKDVFLPPHRVEYTLSRVIDGREFKSTRTASDLFLSGYERSRLRSHLNQEIKDYRLSRKSTQRTVVRVGQDRLEKIGGVFLTSGSIMKIAKKRYRHHLRSPKLPLSDVRHVGIEIEFCCSENRAGVIDAFADAGLYKYVQCKDDGSVVPDDSDGNGCMHECGSDECCECGQPSHSASESDEHGHEICVLANEREIPGIVRRVCAVLKTLNAYVNDTCGLHVHLDMRSRQHETAYKNLVNSLPVLFSMVPASRRDNTYTQENEHSDFRAQLRQGERYRAVNPHAYEEHKTIEIRLHSGTTNAVKINHWITLLIRIANKTKPIPKTNTLRQLTSVVRLPVRLRRYMAERIKRFKDQYESDDRRSA